MKIYTTKKAFARHARQQSGISFYYKGLVLIWKEKQEKKPSDFKRHSGKESLGSTCKSLKTRTYRYRFIRKKFRQNNSQTSMPQWPLILEPQVIQRTGNPISALLLKHMGVDHHNFGPKIGLSMLNIRLKIRTMSLSMWDAILTGLRLPTIASWIFPMEKSPFPTKTGKMQPWKP